MMVVAPGYSREVALLGRKIGGFCGCVGCSVARGERKKPDGSVEYVGEENV